MRTGAAVARHPDWRDALTDLIGQIPRLSGEPVVNRALLFATTEYREDFPDLVARMRGVGTILRDRPSDAY